MSAEHPNTDPSENPTQPESESADAFFAGSEAEMDQLKQELIDAEKRVLLAQADLENFRKRMRREREDELKYANVPLLTDLLPVVDNLQRGIESAEKSELSGSILDGIRLVEKQLLETMKKRGCEPIEAQGQPFDPNLHDAILQQPSTDLEPGTVMHVAQVGYKLYDRVIRPSQVIVSKAPE
ncbi:nucleotide exchange factor GrpE [Blastopirellula marina]|uniref:Protein GrpE n=1 Tax=Blastopirellula marina TaxID=124 RepID=A0A2S8G289_9BACT|nr:nucleotide exchange factor GrpE [Blastopirellula marina]PQO38254.1 nucleotide exchange factor GrpE [Blastopirellula marina]PTL44910.1 nucleotide exchange factor GrpE [Blastopirellula marina]